MGTSVFGEKEFLACCGSTKFAQEMASAAPFATYPQAVEAARDIWFNKVDVNGWLEAFAAHPEIGQAPSSTHKSPSSAQWSKGEQSTALATATDFTLQELYEANTRYRQKFGFVFLICASGRSTPEILAELKKRYPNRPIVEFEIAAKEQMKIIELRLSKLFTTEESDASKSREQWNADVSATAEAKAPVGLPSQIPTRTRPPITTHILDVARGCPAAGVEVLLEKWQSNNTRPVFGETARDCWIYEGSSTTDKDGRSGQLMGVVDALEPGVYRISFNTGKYYPDGFFPHVSIVFEVRESQKWEHFHVPLLLSPFSYSTYRGS